MPLATRSVLAGAILLLLAAPALADPEAPKGAPAPLPSVTPPPGAPSPPRAGDPGTARVGAASAPPVASPVGAASAPTAAAASAPPATASDRALARRHFNLGLALSQRGDHQAAIVEFESAYAAAPLPNILYNLGREYHALARGGSAEAVPRAIDYYRRYLDAKKDAPDRAQVEQSIAMLTGMAAEVQQAVDRIAGGDAGATSPSAVAAPLSTELEDPVAAASRQEARKHFNQAIGLAQRGDHRGAIAEFETAYAAAPLPNILYNLARENQALARGGSVDAMRRSIEQYKRYLAAKPDAPDRAEVEQSATALQSMLAQVEKAVRGITERHSVQPAPLPSVGPDLEELEEQTHTDFDEPVRPADGPGLSRRRRVAAAVLVTASVLLGAGGGVFVYYGGVARDRAGTSTSLDDWSSQRDAARLNNGVGTALLAVGGASLAAGLLTLAWPRDTGRATTALWVTPTAGGVLAGGSFP